MKVIFQIDGGIGKSVAATAVCKAIKKQCPDDQLLVITGYPEVFLCNPNVDKVFNFNNLNYFYQDHIAGQQVKMCLHNPYMETNFITEHGHLIKIWCEMFGIEYNGEQPELFLNSRELSFFGNKYASEKPIMVVHTNGGAQNQPNKYSWTRDLPMGLAQQIVNAFAQQYNILHIRREDQLALQNTTPVQAEFRSIATLIALSSKRLFIDSFCQHTAAALGKPSVVCWVGNTPAQFGYDIHTNVVANSPTIKPELRHSVFSKYNITGQPTEFPYNSENEIFDGRKIYDALVSEAIDDNKSPETKNIIIRDKIKAASKSQNMVARRLELLSKKVSLGNISRVLDIGSWHLGQSIEFSNIFHNASIDAFEPVPDSFNLCLKNLGALSDEKKKRIKVHNLALSNVKSQIPFYVADRSANKNIDAGFSSMFKFNDALFDHSSAQKEIKVNSDTLDNWCKENEVKDIDIIWMDVQGSELLVLKGAENTLKNTKIIMTEVGLKPYYEGHTLKKDIDDYLATLGFSELEGAFELNGFDYEANTIYIKN